MNKKGVLSENLQDNASTVKEVSEEKARNPIFASVLCFISAIFFSLMYLNTKVIYLFYPSITFQSISILRSIGSLIFILPILLASKNGRKALKDTSILLDWKFLIAVASNVCIGSIVQYELGFLPITTIAIILNLGPILTVFTATCLMPE